MSATSPIWPEMEESHPLNTLHTELATLLSEEPAHKIWGITLSPEPGHFSTLIILQKFLRANKGDKEKAKKQFEDTLQWRRGYFDENGKVIGGWDESKFEDLAYITEETVKSAGAEEGKKTIVTWNIYGHVKDFAKTFGDVEEFLCWRVGLMERSIELLDLASAREPIPDWDSGKPTVDPYQAIQVHDYLQVSFFRTPAEVKNASRKTIELFQKYYPELLEKKFFVNVPVLMGWVYNAMKLLIAKETFKKLTMLSYGEELAKHMGSESIPSVYGGKGEPLKESAISPAAEVVENDNAVKDDTESAPAEIAPAPTTEVVVKEEPTPSAIPETTNSEAKATEDATPDHIPAPTNQTVPEATVAATAATHIDDASAKDAPAKDVPVKDAPVAEAAQAPHV